VSEAKGTQAGAGSNPAVDNTKTTATDGPQFGQPEATPDPKTFLVKHASDSAAYAILDKEPNLPPLPFPKATGGDEPAILLSDVAGSKGKALIDTINSHGQIVFHAVGDTGNTRSTGPQNEVADKMMSDYGDADPKNVPAFFYHLGDVVYSFGEAEYYYDQFYEPYRDYPAPIFAIAGNHDGMVAPNTTVPSLQAFLANFCTAGQPSHITPEAGGLPRTAMVQPGVYFTLEAPFVRILGLYSNRLEGPGIISSQGKYKNIGDWQLTYLQSALSRVKAQKFGGAVIIAVHHPPYSCGGQHPGSPRMLQDIDSICSDVGVWPHAVLSGHAHNYQRFTRIVNPGKGTEMQIPFVIGGNGGHAVNRLTNSASPVLRTPLREQQQELKNGSDQVVLENYDDQDYGYLRIVVDAMQLRIEYHPQSDGANAKTPDDSVTVNLKDRKLIHYQPIGTSGGANKPAQRTRHRRS
jgi:predicted phosphodiesterase